MSLCSYSKEYIIPDALLLWRNVLQNIINYLLEGVDLQIFGTILLKMQSSDFDMLWDFCNSEQQTAFCTRINEDKLLLSSYVIRCQVWQDRKQAIHRESIMKTMSFNILSSTFSWIVDSVLPKSTFENFDNEDLKVYFDLLTPKEKIEEEIKNIESELNLLQTTAIQTTITEMEKKKKTFTTTTPQSIRDLLEEDIRTKKNEMNRNTAIQATLTAKVNRLNKSITP